MRRSLLLGLLLVVAASQAMAESHNRPVRLPPTAAVWRSTARPRARVEPLGAKLRLVDQIELPQQELPGPQPEVVSVPAGSVLLTLDTAIETALRSNPALITLRQTVPVSRAALALAGTYPHDPVVQTTVLPSTRLPDGGYGSTVVSVQAMETLEIAHQPRWRWQAGSAQLSATEWRIAQAEVQGVAETTRRFFAVLYRRELHRLTARLAELNEELLGVLQRRFQAGQATAGDVALGAIEARAARQQAGLAAAALRAVEIDLRLYLGLPPGGRFVVAGDIRNWSWRPADEVLAAHVGQGPAGADALTLQSDWAVGLMADGRPDVAAARANLAAAVAQGRLARANRIPNIDVGPYYEQNEDSTEFWGVVTQMTLPTFGSRRALTRQRSAEVQQSQVALQQLRRQATLEIGAALNLYERWRTVTLQYATRDDTDLLGQVRTVEDLFEAGQSDLLRVYAARTRTMQVLIEYLQALDSLAQAASNVIQSVAIPPDALLTPLDPTRL